MDRKSFLAHALVAGSLAPAAVPAQTPDAGGRFEDFCNLFYRQKQVRRAFEAHVAVDYIQHSAGMAQGREAAIQALEPMFARANFRASPVRTLWDKDLSMVILDVRVGDDVRAIVIDLYRHAAGRIIEHWDVKSEIDPERRGEYFNGLQRR